MGPSETPAGCLGRAFLLSPLDMAHRASMQWRDLAPEPHVEPHVFTVADAVPAGLPPFAVIREDEGLTLVSVL